MTVIAAAKTATGVVMAADSRVTAGWQKSTHDSPKIWATNTGFIVGGAGCLRTIQVLRHYTIWPRVTWTTNSDFEGYAVKYLWPAMRDAAKSHGVLKTADGIESISATILFATGSHIVEVSGNGAVIEDPLGRMAIGSGYAEALGSLGDIGPWDQLDVIEAVRRSSISARGVGGAITVVNTRDLTVRTFEGQAAA